jgi:hypothetical protein
LPISDKTILKTSVNGRLSEQAFGGRDGHYQQINQLQDRIPCYSIFFNSKYVDNGAVAISLRVSIGTHRPSTIQTDLIAVEMNDLVVTSDT